MKRLLLAIVVTAAVPSQAWAQHNHPTVVPALYATKAEAEQAAAKFNCTGAHQMGQQWMPCAKHSESKTHAH